MKANTIIRVCLILLVMLLTLYPLLELTRLIIVAWDYYTYMGLEYRTELILMWGAWLLIPPVLWIWGRLLK